MAATMAATAVAAVLLLFLVLSRRAASAESEAGGASNRTVVECRESGRRMSTGRRKGYVSQPAEPPATWKEKVALVAGTTRFIYSETLGKWPLSDLFLGIRHHIRRPGNREIATVYAGSNCVELKGHEIMIELIHMLRLLTLCFLFSKKPYPVLLESAGYTEEDVLLKETKAGLLKPAFTILRDKNSKSFFLVIRGALSIKDKLTAATGALVPFHHLVSHEGCISNLIIGYAHCGMVTAARWIAKCATPSLLRAVNEYPDYHLKIIGHSMGASIAALLSYILREREEFSSSTCVAFGPAACMTWDLAESGKQFVTAIVNATDLVPTFSAVSVSNLRSEIKASSWLANQIHHTRFLNGLHRCMTTIRSSVPSVSVARARVTSASKFLKPVSKSSEVVIKRAKNVAHAVVTCRSSISSWSCMTKRQYAFGTHTSLDEEEVLSSLTTLGSNSIVSKGFGQKAVLEKPVNCSVVSGYECLDGGEEFSQLNHVLAAAQVEGMTEGQYWFDLEKELHRHSEDMQSLKTEKEENMVLIEAVENTLPMISNTEEVHQLYPPGKIMHMVAMPALDFPESVDDALSNRSIGIYEIPRELYGKIRLSQTMIDDHYMPRYSRMMELLIDKLRRENNNCTSIA